MSHSAKPRWIIRTVAAPMLLSLALHGLLFLALWHWPTRTRGPALTIESTCVTLESCVLDSPSATLLPSPELPPELLGQEIDTSLAPRLEEVTPASSPRHPVADAGAGSGNGYVNTPHVGDGNLFSLPAAASSVVYVLDCSLTMGIGRKLDFARRELIASLRRLPPSMRFQVIDFNEFAESLIVDGQRGLLPAEPSVVERAISHLEALGAAGETNHFVALRLGLDLHPDVLFFLTDADDLKPEVVAAITQRNRRTVIHTIELTQLRTGHAEGPLAKLAGDNHGTYTYRRVAFGDSP
jgi:hypothetical protein